MNQKHLPHVLTAFVTLFAIVACVLPGQVPQSAPTPSSLNIETAVAGTARAAELQTQQASPATATAITISTDTPPEVISSFGTSLVKLADDSTQFRDYRAGVQILFPPNWMPIRVGEPEYYAASEKIGTQNSWFLEEIGWIQSLDVNVFRVNAYDTHPEHLFYGTLPKINVVYQQGDTRTLKQAEADEKKMIEHSVRAEDEFLSSDFQTISGGLQVLVFQSQWNAQTFDKTHYTGTFFNVPTGLVIIDFYIPSDHKEALLPEYDQVINSITLFTP